MQYIPNNRNCSLNADDNVKYKFNQLYMYFKKMEEKKKGKKKKNCLGYLRRYTSFRKI